jgi:hypothetical protein|tara:strand:+ start:16293 stop:17093 length:801 start_codon:yes stop_codon:yes gene_type:complete
MKKTIFILFILSITICNAQNNIILNGSFELNNATDCFEELYTQSDYNATVSFSTSFGYAIVLMQDSCLRCPSQTFWGGGVQDGDRFAYLFGKPFISPQGNGWMQSKLSLELNIPLSNKKNYKLSFWIKDPPPAPPVDTPACSDPLNNLVHIGTSNYDNQFGTHIYSSPLGDSIWKQYSIVFNTQNEEEYITVQVDTGNISQHGVFIDNFVLVETEEQPNAVYELNAGNKKLIKIVDVLGRESKPNSNTPLFYIYSDGTVEKKLIIE